MVPAENVVEPHPLKVGVPKPANVKVGNTTVTVSPTRSGTLSAKVKVIEVGAAVTGLSIRSELYVMAGVGPVVGTAGESSTAAGAMSAA